MPTLARRTATRSARVGAAQQRGAACARPARGGRWRWRVPEAQRRARSAAPPRRREPHRRAEAGKAGLATWTAAGKRRMSVVPPQRASRLTFGARCAAHAAGWNSSPRSAGRRHVARSGRRCAGVRSVSRQRDGAGCRWVRGRHAARARCVRWWTVLGGWTCYAWFCSRRSLVSLILSTASGRMPLHCAKRGAPFPDSVSKRACEVKRLRLRSS